MFPTVVSKLNVEMPTLITRISTSKSAVSVATAIYVPEQPYVTL